MSPSRLAAVAAALALSAVTAVTAAPALRLVATAGDAAPGGGTFERFTVESLPIVAPVNARGQVVFFASLGRAPAGEGFFLFDGRRIVKVAVEGDRAPGGGTFSGFGRHPVPALNARGSVAFAAALAGARAVEGIFVWDTKQTRPVALTGAAAPGIASGTLAVVEAPAINTRGDVAFLATIRRGRETVEAIYARTARGLVKVVAQGDPAPAGGVYAGFGVPALTDDGAVVFGAAVEGRGVPGGIFVAQGERVRMVLGAGDDTPVGGIYA